MSWGHQDILLYTYYELENNLSHYNPKLSYQDKKKKHKCETAHLADMISENWLILCASDLPLEPRLRLPIVGNLQCSCTIANLWQIRHGVSDSDGSVNSPITSVERHNLVYRTVSVCGLELQVKK